MRPWQRKPDPFSQPTKNPMNIGDVWASGQSDDYTLKPPKSNDLSQVPFTRLIHNVEYLSDLRETIPIDTGLVELIQRKVTAMNGSFCRKAISLTLMQANGDVFTVELWVIPVFYDGILIHYLFAADDANQALIREHRNPTAMKDYDISSF